MAKYIWIDKNILNDENRGYAEDLEKKLSIKILRCINIGEAMNLIKDYDFLETKIIVSGRLYLEFYNSFKENLINMRIVPKVIIFTGNVERFLERNKEYKNVDNSFYNIGSIATIYDEVENFLKNEEINIDQYDTIFTTQTLEKTFSPNSSTASFKSGNNSFSLLDEPELVFEYIDGKDKLILPLFFKALIDNTSNEHMEKYTNFLYETYSKEKEQIKELLSSIKLMINIPIEILSKYYAKLYTCDSNFHKDINKDLGLNKKKNIYLLLKHYMKALN